ncbi:MAG: recombinase family protein, partial [Gemmataceae bacterium]|nr:recombinase family protein [Gemmataceae bacterium]
MADSGELRGVAFSYVRFSAKEQERGDSLRRQTDLRDKWLARHPSITLDTSLTLEDLGVSAFRGRNRLDDAHALGQFVRAVENGRVARGSLLLIENLDRLSREQEEDALELFLKLLKAGIVIVQLQPETVFRKGDGMFGLMRAIMELGRGHAESARKSERVTAAWDERKRKAAAGGIVTARCPAWLEVEGGRFKVRPGAAALIRRLFALCKAGHGCRAIAAALNKEGVPGWGKGPWEEAYIRKIIQGRAVLGEFRPMKGRGGRGGKRVADAAAPVVP